MDLVQDMQPVTDTGRASPFLSRAVGPGERAEAALRQGFAWLDVFRPDEAEPFLREALALAPHDSEVLRGMAELHQRRGTNPAAQIDFAFRAVSVDFNSAAAQKSFGIACRALGLEPLAIGHLRRCVELDPADSNARFQLGSTLIQFGHWEEGWTYYEQRPVMATANGYCKPTPPGYAEWRGEDLSGKTIALLGEDGHGDQIQYFRFAHQVLAMRPRRLVLDVRPALRRLFVNALGASAAGVEVSAVRLEEVGPDVDYVLAFESMGARFGANGDNLSAACPYLRPSRAAPSRPTQPIRVGIVWRGEPSLDTDRIRSIPLAVLAPFLIRSASVQWVSLQHGEHRPEELALLDEYGIQTPVGPHFDFLDTADVVAGLDLVIAVDTSVAHLAAAMGTPVWLLNRATSEWRWGWKVTDSPWYPSVRIFNQETVLDWAPVLGEVQQVLSEVIETY